MRRTPATLAALAVTAATFCVLVPPGPSAAAAPAAVASTAAASVATVAAAAAAAAAGTVRLTSYNICGDMCSSPPYDPARRIATVAAEAEPGGWDADQLFLQEVCEHQYRGLLDRLGPLGYAGFHSATLPAGNPAICEGHAYGNAVLVRGPVSDTAELDLTVGGEREPITVPCALSSLADRPTWSCSVHLYWDDGTLAVPEADRLAAQARRWLDEGFTVVLGGDFNHSPRTATLSRFYRPERGTAPTGPSPRPTRATPSSSTPPSAHPPRHPHAGRARRPSARRSSTTSSSAPRTSAGRAPTPSPSTRPSRTTTCCASRPPPDRRPRPRRPGLISPPAPAR
ncbi:endonuclease/exonuclease/phosphatase family protein [Streptomyces sp. MS1.HAVA.3]|uniref:Endonuclease/exonuclease/phosphatase family protein n=1 Tax=Streptomyces caledonius TaxID=3134107 RepID=A0ABU8UDL4_9ACTN